MVVAFQPDVDQERGVAWDEILGLISSPESCRGGGGVKGHEAKSRRQEL